MTAQLAVTGALPVRATPMPAWPQCNEEAVQAAVSVLRSGKLNYWTGDHGALFEKEFASYIGRQFGIALANGTVALEAALYALNIGHGDEVIVPSRTFIATASCAALRGATPVVADIDPDSQTLTAETARRVLSPRTKAIIAVHLAGWPCDMDPIMELAREHGLKVIEDCAQSHGARYKGRMAGSLGDVAAFSFCQDKIMTTGGEGGMLVTDDSEVFERAWSFKDHGKNYLKARASHNEPGVFRWMHDSFGTNCRMTEIQSAIGRAALRRLDEHVAIRRRNADILIDRLGRIASLHVPVPRSEIKHAYYKFYAFIRPEMLSPGWTRDAIIAAINAEGVPCFSGVCPEIYMEQAFVRIRPQERLLVARRLGETSLMFLVHPTLETSDMLDTCTAVEKVMAIATTVECRLLQPA